MICYGLLGRQQVRIQLYLELVEEVEAKQNLYCTLIIITQVAKHSQCKFG